MSTKPLVATPSELTMGKRKPDLVDVPARTVLSLDGAGAPTDPVFAASIGALFGVAYTLRFTRKAERRPVFKVGPLEGEWRVKGHNPSAGGLPPANEWRWCLRMGVPDNVAKGDLAAAKTAVTKKPKGTLEGSPEAQRIELMQLEAARFARILHVGPYATEPESFAKIGALLEENGLKREPWHIEVYLSDPGRTAPEKLRTVLLVKVR
jgi:hypothetical protein